MESLRRIFSEMGTLCVKIFCKVLKHKIESKFYYNENNDNKNLEDEK